MAKASKSKTFPIGRDVKTGQFVSVETHKRSGKKSYVVEHRSKNGAVTRTERMPVKPKSSSSMDKTKSKYGKVLKDLANK